MNKWVSFSNLVRACILALGLWALPAHAQGDVAALIKKALAHQDQGQWDEAIATLGQALSLAPTNPRIYVLRGMTYQSKGDIEAALKDFDQALTINPKSVLAWYSRGTLHLDQGQNEQAVEAFNQVIQLDAGDPNALFLRAIALFRGKKSELALDSVNQALKASPRYAEAHCLRGLLELNSANAPAALADFQQALHLKNDYPMAYYGKGRALESMGDLLGAQQNLTFACALNPVFCDRDSFMKADPSLLVVNALSQVANRYCVCCLIHDSEGQHVENQVQNLLNQRREVQLGQLAKAGMKLGFSFEDRVIESGITFEHRCTEDSGSGWRPVHYDHGNGVNVADVDGDGHLDVLFLTQVGSNQLWRGQGGGTFENITSRAGIALADKICVGAAFGDIDNDGDPDLFITTVRMGNHLFENQGNGNFRDITDSAGLNDGAQHSSGALFWDYDNDGKLDLFVTNVGSYTLDNQLPAGNYQGRKDAFAGHLHPDRTEFSVLYRNQGNNQFANVNKETGLNDGSWSGDATFTDLNGDRFPDLYLLNMQGDDHYYINHGGQRFEDKTADYFKKTPWGAMGVKFFDYDNDGDMDLYITDMHSDMSQKVGPDKETLKADMQWDDQFLQGGANNVFGNAFYVNPGQPSLTESSDALGVENYWPWGLSVGDLDADGFQDIFVASSMNFPWRYGINSVFMNDRKGRFESAEFALAVEPRPVTIKPWFAVNCEGADANRHPVCKTQNGVAVVWGTLGSRTSAIYDIDEDGDLDILTGEFNALPQVLISNLSDQKAIQYLKIRLVGSRSNRDGLGARVTVTCGSTQFTRYHDGKSGYLSQSLMPLYFGLGSAIKVDQIKVEWPSGQDQMISDNIPVNRQVTIREPNP